MKIKEEKGVTLLALVIMIVIILIIAGITLYSGKETIERAKLEELKTNMLLVQAKAREYVEEANFKLGIGTAEEKAGKLSKVREEIYVTNEKLKKAENIPADFNITDTSACYYLTKETKEKWGLEKLEDEEQYLIQFDEENVTVEIYNKDGYDGKYKLSEIEQIQE